MARYFSMLQKCPVNVLLIQQIKPKRIVKLAYLAIRLAGSLWKENKMKIDNKTTAKKFILEHRVT